MIEELLAFMKEEMTNQYVGHDYDHSVRVYNTACLIGASEDCDMVIVIASAIVHDYIDHKLFDNIEEQKQKLTNKLIEVGFHSDKIQRIFDIIEHMSYSKGETMTTIEGKIVQDADRIDALGAIGIARTFAYGGSKGRALYGADDSSVQHFHDKLFKLKNLMNTSKGKTLAIERHEFMIIFLDQLKREIR